jgi:VanZ family protein
MALHKNKRLRKNRFFLVPKLFHHCSKSNHIRYMPLNKQTPTRFVSPGTFLHQWFTRWLFLAFWAYALLLVVMNLTPGNTQHLEMKKILFVRSDYFYHASAYAILVILYIMAAFSPHPVFRKYRIAAGLVVMILLATVPEALQNYVPQRRFNWWDMFANFTGLAIGAALMLSTVLCDKKTRSNRKEPQRRR